MCRRFCAKRFLGQQQKWREMQKVESLVREWELNCVLVLEGLGM